VVLTTIKTRLASKGCILLELKLLLDGFFEEYSLLGFFVVSLRRVIKPFIKEEVKLVYLNDN
jgi:hypothetical protein